MWYLILDEGEGMVDMGFYDEIMEIVKLVGKEGERIMFWGRMGGKIEELGEKIVDNGGEVKVGVWKGGEKMVEGGYIWYEKEKLGMMGSVLGEERGEGVIMLGCWKLKVKEVGKGVKEMKVKVGEMEWEVEEGEGEEVM